MNIIKVISIIDPTKSYEYIDTGNPIKGGVKDVHFSPDRKYVVAFFRENLDFNQKDRIKRIVGLYLENIKKGQSSDFYLDDIFRWPYDAVEKNGKIFIKIFQLPNFIISLMIQGFLTILLALCRMKDRSGEV